MTFYQEVQTCARRMSQISDYDLICTPYHNTMLLTIMFNKLELQAGLLEKD